MFCRHKHTETAAESDRHEKREAVSSVGRGSLVEVWFYRIRENLSNSTKRCRTDSDEIYNALAVKNLYALFLLVRTNSVTKVSFNFVAFLFDEIVGII